MDYKRLRIEPFASTRDVASLEVNTGNIYESIMIIAKRANQISQDLKEELHEKISGFQTPSDSLEEIFENKEQIEIAKSYESIPKPTLLALREFQKGKIYHRNPVKERNNSNF